MNLVIEEVSEQIAALALQGPNALRILEGLVDVDLHALKFFRLTPAKMDSLPVIISRTGYTGDLGYEIWLDTAYAGAVWDALIQKGKYFGIKPAGMLALDVARLEAGFILLDVDYISAERALIPSQRYSPFEIGLGWTVDLSKSDFVGHRALRQETDPALSRQIVGVEISLSDYEYLFQQARLPPQFPLAAWRGGVPVYQDDRQIGHATTGAWSPVLKKYIALATVKKQSAAPGTLLEVEVTVEHRRNTASARVVKTPFFDPPRKRGSPPV
jgi:aminomethyltransferase